MSASFATGTGLSGRYPTKGKVCAENSFQLSIKNYLYTTRGSHSGHEMVVSPTESRLFICRTFSMLMLTRIPVKFMQILVKSMQSRCIAVPWPFDAKSTFVQNPPESMYITWQFGWIMVHCSQREIITLVFQTRLLFVKSAGILNK